MAMAVDENRRCGGRKIDGHVTARWAKRPAPGSNASVALHSIEAGPPPPSMRIMKLQGSVILFLFGLTCAVFAQEAGPGRTPAPPQAQAQDKAPDQAEEKPNDRSPQQAPAGAPIVDRNVKGRTGRDIRLIILTNLRPDCTSGPMPTVRLIAAPKNGKVTVRRARLKATNVRQCLAIEVPALIAIYRSAAGFEGADTAILEVRPFEGKPQLRRFQIGITDSDPRKSI